MYIPTILSTVFKYFKALNQFWPSVLELEDGTFMMVMCMIYILTRLAASFAPAVALNNPLDVVPQYVRYEIGRCSNGRSRVWRNGRVQKNVANLDETRSLH